MNEELLNIVNETGEIVGTETREQIHRHGFLHREIYVWFYTQSGEIIFQHRSKNKDTFPDLLDATVGGHVEIGDDFEQTALKEAEEETGVVLEIGDLKFIKLIRSSHQDAQTGMKNNVIRKVFAFAYTGSLENLKIEQGKCDGFEAWSISDLKQLSGQEAARFKPGLLDPDYIKLYQTLVDQ